MKNKIAVLGAGTWGIALAKLLAKNNEVVVWSALKSELDYLCLMHKHPNLPCGELPQNIEYSDDIEFCVKEKNIIIIAVPSIYVRNVAQLIKEYCNINQIIVCVAKGIEDVTLYTMSEVIRDELDFDNFNIVALSGPTHAEEVSLDMPTTIVSACNNLIIAEKVQTIFTNDNFRVYTNSDICGVELCGAVKNIIALSCGIARGLGYGDNAIAALITRGLAELTRLGVSMGCFEQTFSGLAGIGDLIVTATSVHSRNNKFGYLLGKGYKIDDAKKEVGMIVEGLYAIKPTLELAKRYNVDMPIVSAVKEILDGYDSKEVAYKLFYRRVKTELPRTSLELCYESKIIRNRRNMGMKRVITYGTFDLLHYGHINLLKRAKALGDYLVVVLSTDEFNWKEKGKKCYFTYEQRKALLESIRYVDLVIPEENWNQKRTDVHEYHIDTFVMGDDWKGKFDFLKEEGVEVVYLPRTPEISTTQIKNDLHK